MTIKLHSDRPLFLNVGCGDDIKHDSDIKWINIDIRQIKKADYIMDAAQLDFADKTFHGVYVAHILEHFPLKNSLDIIKEWVRVLKEYGILFIAVPDILKIAKGFVKGKVGADMVMKYLYGGQGYDENFHKAGFCKSTLTNLMESAGLKDIHTWERNKSDASGSFYSLNLKGVKE